MASESSSAVLDLNDADTEDTEAPSVTDDTQEGAPLIMEHGYDIAVKVDAPLKQLSTLETFVTYRVRCVCARWPTPPYVRRRYNHFKVLHRRISQSQPLLAAPALPPLHSARQQLDRYSPAFVAIRTLALHAFLDRVAKHPILTHSEDFRIFLTTPDDELDKVFKSENSALNLWGLSSALYGNSADSKPVNGARVRDPEFTSASEYLQSLQHKLTALCALTTKLYKGSTALRNEYMGMKRACDAWSSQARGRVSRACAGVSLGSGAAGGALARLRPPLHARATLPLLAAYAGAHVEKIRQRDAIHAAHVSGTSTDEVHNRLEQASEALRCELADWTPKTRADIKSILLESADSQVAMFTQVLIGWEHALKLSTEANIEDLFKTVSKTAVQNLSPSKCKADATPSETERDFDDLDNYSDSDIQDMRLIDDDRHIGVQNDEIIGQNDLRDSVKELLEEEIGLSKESNENGSKEQLVGSKVDENGLKGKEIGSKVEENKLKGKENGVTELNASKDESEKSKVFSDPLQDFSEVDLSS